MCRFNVYRRKDYHAMHFRKYPRRRRQFTRLVSDRANGPRRRIWSCKFAVGIRINVRPGYHDMSASMRRVGVDATPPCSGSRIIRASARPMMSHRVYKFIRCAIHVYRSVSRRCQPLGDAVQDSMCAHRCARIPVGRVSTGGIRAAKSGIGVTRLYGISARIRRTLRNILFWTP